MKTAAEWGKMYALAFYEGDPRDPPDGGEWPGTAYFVAAVQRDALEAAAKICEGDLGYHGAFESQAVTAAKRIRELKP